MSAAETMPDSAPIETPAAPAAPAPAAPAAPAAQARPFAAAPGTPPAPAPVAPTIPLPDWAAGLDPERAAFVADKGWKSLDDMVKSHAYLERFRGMPADKIMEKPDWSKPESVAKYRATMGIPEAPEGYKGLEVALPTGTLETQGLAALAHKINLTQEQYEGFLNGTGELLTGVFQAEAERMATQSAAEMALLKKEWGPSYAANDQLANNAIAQVGITADEYEAMKSSPLGEAGTLRMLAKIGARFGEHAPPREGAGQVELRTPDWATQRMVALRNDQNFIAKMNAGDSTATAEWNNLLRIAYGE